MSLKKVRLKGFDFWTLVTILGYIIVFLLLILPLFNIFKASFIDKETGALSLSNYREFFSKTYYTSAIPNKRNADDTAASMRYLMPASSECSL